MFNLEDQKTCSGQVFGGNALCVGAMFANLRLKDNRRYADHRRPRPAPGRPIANPHQLGLVLRIVVAGLKLREQCLMDRVGCLYIRPALGLG